MPSHNRPQPAASPRRLLPRERQVAELARRGLSNTGIAEALDILRLDSAYSKPGVNSRSGRGSAVTADPGLIQAGASVRKPGMTAPEPAEYMPDPGKPDPLSARTLSELEDRLRSLWEWAGQPASRKLAIRSGGAFSHATVSKLIHDKPRKPPLKFEYVLGLVRACGAGRAEQQRWIAAWLNLTRDPGNHRHPAGYVQAARGRAGPQAVP
jgi:hypothetical protein